MSKRTYRVTLSLNGREPYTRVVMKETRAEAMAKMAYWHFLFHMDGRGVNFIPWDAMIESISPAGRSVRVISQVAEA